MSETLSYPSLIAGTFPRQTEKVTLAAGTDLLAGAILGRIDVAALAAGAAVPGGSNVGNGVAGTVTPGSLAEIGNYLLECIAIAAATAGVAAAAWNASYNQGNGTITAAPTVGALAKVGRYRLVCIEPVSMESVFSLEDPDGVTVGVAFAGTAYADGALGFTITEGVLPFQAGDEFAINVTAVEGNAGTFSVFDPQGHRLADLTVGVAYDNGAIALTIADGTTDFAVGDTFTIAVSQAAGNGKYALCDKTATDGSQDPIAVLAEDSAAAAEDTYPVIYRTGCFNSGAVSYAAGTVLADVKTALEARSIFLVTADNNVNV